MNKKITRNLLGILLITAMVCTAFGCKHSRLTKEEYAAKADEFYGQIIEYGTKMDTIDPKDTDSSKQLLDVLDDFNDSCKVFSELNPPKELSDAKEKAISAANLMYKAVSEFHTALDGEEVDAVALDSARFDYGNAIIEIKNIGIALQNAN